MKQPAARRCAGDLFHQPVLKARHARFKRGARQFRNEHLIAVGKVRAIGRIRFDENEIAGADFAGLLFLILQAVPCMLEMKNEPARRIRRAIERALDGRGG